MRALLPDPAPTGAPAAIESSPLGDHLALVDLPDPVPGPGQVLIRVLAAGVNRADLAQARGRYDPPAGAPLTLGLECAGTVEAVGPVVSRWRVGDAVCALVSGGACADLCLAEDSLTMPLPLTSVRPVPEGRVAPGFSPVSDERALDVAFALDLTTRVPHVLAATMVEAAATAWMTLVDEGGLSPDPELNEGRSVLIHGGTGSVGTIAIQVARALGVRVLATAGSHERALTCVTLGAHAAIDRHDDVHRFVRDHTDGFGVDVVVDVGGAGGFGANLASLSRHGVLVVIGLLGGSQAQIDLARLLGHDLTVRGTTLRGRSLEARARICSALETYVWPLVRRGLVRPVLAGVAPLEDAADLHRSVLAGVHIGSRVLLP